MDVVVVEGKQLGPEDFAEGAGWCEVRKKKKANCPTESAENHQTQSQRETPATSTMGIDAAGATAAQLKRRCARQVQKLAMASRMPALPAEDYKIVVRPRGGFNVTDYGTDRIYCCLRNAAGIGKEAAEEDSICINIKQNVVVLSTPSEDRAIRYGAICKLRIGDREFEANAYRAAPENTSKGLIKNISKTETQADIVSNLVTLRNPGVLHAKRMGTTDNIVVLFKGYHVPRYVYYGPMLVRCSLYRKHIEVCYQCGRLGHRADVCPNPNNKICRGCRSTNPPPDHQCEPQCQLCGKNHFTGDRSCKARYKTPYIIKRRQMERPRRDEEAVAAYDSGCSSSSINCGSGGSYYHNRRGRSSSGGSRKSQSRSRSRAPRSRSKSRTRGGGGPGVSAVDCVCQGNQQPQRGHRGNVHQVSWAAVAASPGAGAAGEGRAGGPAAVGAGGSELELAIERALQQRLRPLETTIAELRRENALLREENSKLKGAAPRPQQPQLQERHATPSTPLSPTPSRPEPAGMDTDDESGSVETADERENRPPTGKRIALDPARPDNKKRCGRYEKLRQRVDNIEKNLDERFAKQMAQMDEMFNNAIAKLSEHMTQMFATQSTRINDIEARLPPAAGRPIRTIKKPYARQQPNQQQQQNTQADVEAHSQQQSSHLDGDGLH
ncbi:hypothetical protein HPB50_014977 [Hyalomma asiaticum]|uniref:Uncharacterized protein n=1 Tax=Hyalomma asiaticum TaxID=266040 RepID=A0ACB7SNF3_HYAAI|nr:hypothetical protein HPB50_014977 [Hyalomma asiaticum]